MVVNCDIAVNLHFIVRSKLRDLMWLEVVPEWYSLGLELGLTEHALNIIEKDHEKDVSSCKGKIFSKWLSSVKDPSYSGLVDALIIGLH